MQPSPSPSPLLKERRPVASSREWSVNLLYKRTLIPAASHCAKIPRRLRATACYSFLRPRSGSGKKAGRSPAQAGHDFAEQRTKQEIHRRRFGLDQQTGERRHILRPEEIEFEELLSNRTVLHATS